MRIKTKTEIILETAEFYGSDPSLRAGGVCEFYLYVDPNGNRCAFSRCCVDDDENNKILKTNEGFGVTHKLLNIVRLKPEYNIKDLEFWQQIQRIHDTSHFYDNEEKGLSVSGWNYVSSLLEEYKQ